MKINDLHQIGPVQQASTNSPARPTPQDKVSLERTRELNQAVEEAKLSAGAARGNRLAALAASIAAGTFKANPQQLADKLLQAAELDARLRQLLG